MNQIQRPIDDDTASPQREDECQARSPLRQFAPTSKYPTLPAFDGLQTASRISCRQALPPVRMCMTAASCSPHPTLRKVCCKCVRIACTEAAPGSSGSPARES